MKLFSVIAFTVCAFSFGAWAAEAPATHEAPTTHEAPDTDMGAITREPKADAKDAHGKGAHGEAHGGGHGPAKPYDLEIVKQPVSDTENATRPAMPVLQSPEVLAKVTGTNVTLKWQEVKGASVYHIQVATDPNFKWLIVDEENFPQTSFQPQGLTAGQNYFWRVAARKPGNWASYTKSFFSSSSFATK